MNAFVDGFQTYLHGAPHLAYLAAFTGGVLTSFTPCVYPMIPLTVAYIGGRSAGAAPMRGFFLSVFYVLGVAITYSSLGAAAALTGTLFGRMSTSPVAYFLVANVCVIMGLGMLDVFQVSTPAFLRKYEPAKRRGTYIGALVIGIFSGLVATPCTAPVLGVILAFVAAKQNLFFGISLLFVFALGMGLLLVLVGTSAGALAGLPKSGKWMVFIKKAFGVVLIAIGEYFLVLTGKMLI